MRGEALFRKNIIVPLLAKHKAHVTRIESPMHGVGFPDLNVCIGGQEINIELKYGVGCAPRVRETQLKWFKNRILAGGKPIVIAWLEVGGVSYICVYEGYKIMNLYTAKSRENWLSLADYKVDYMDYKVGKDQLIRHMLEYSKVHTHF
jgi:hypothetical protein